jgi:hypothetical protein
MSAVRLHWNHTLGALALVALLTVLLGGCGKKGPPIPPNLTPPSGVSLLEVAADGAQVSLRWQLNRPSADVTGYAIYRSAYPLSDPECPTCRQKFVKIASMEQSTGKAQMTFSQAVDRGFRYTYKIRPFDKWERLGPDSNPLGVDVP